MITSLTILQYLNNVFIYINIFSSVSSTYRCWNRISNWQLEPYLNQLEHCRLLRRWHPIDDKVKNLLHIIALLLCDVQFIAKPWNWSVDFASNSSSLRLEIDLPKSDSHIDSIMLQLNVTCEIELQKGDHENAENLQLVCKCRKCNRVWYWLYQHLVLLQIITSSRNR